MAPAWAIAFLLSASTPRFFSAPAACLLAPSDSPDLTSAIRSSMPPAWAIAFLLSASTPRFISAPAALSLASADSPDLT
eukprot:139508-Prorocentrum_minimum.AAC.1